MKQSYHKSRFAYSFNLHVAYYLIGGIFIIVGRILIPIQQEAFRNKGAQNILVPLMWAGIITLIISISIFAVRWIKYYK